MVIFRFLLLFSFFSYSAWGGGFDPSKERERAERHYQALREIPPFATGQDEEEDREFNEDYVRAFDGMLYDEQEALLGPYFEDNLDGPTGLYESAVLCNPGGKTGVFKVILKEDRPAHGLKKGDAIAVRCACTSPYCWIGDSKSLCNLVRGSRLKPYTPYFPEFYGYFLSKMMPPSLVQGETALGMKRSPGMYYYRYEEMTLVDGTFEDYSPRERKLTPDSVIFEMTLGEWASRHYLRITIGDLKDRNFGVKQVPYYRCYRLGNTRYLFAPGSMPVRLDLDDYSVPKRMRFNKIFLRQDWLETQEARGFAREMENREGDIFTLFQQHFSKYMIPDDLVMPTDAPVQYFTIPAKDIELERSLPVSKQQGCFDVIKTHCCQSTSDVV